jgi:Cation transport ATPase
MTTVERRADPLGSVVPGLPVVEAAADPAEEVLAQLGSSANGLTEFEAGRRFRLVGPNAVRSHHVQPLRILGRQLRNAVLILLGVTALVSFFLGQRADTIVIALILLASIGLGFVNELRAERAAEALHSRVKHRAVVTRDGRRVAIDVTLLVPGDVVQVALGEIVPADLRLLSATGLECDESALTGESMPAECAAADRGADHGGRRGPAADVAALAHPRLHAVAGRLLPRARRDGGGLSRRHRVREATVLRPRRSPAPARPSPGPAAPGPAAGCPVQRRAIAAALSR